MEFGVRGNLVSEWERWNENEPKRSRHIQVAVLLVVAIVALLIGRPLLFHEESGRAGSKVTPNPRAELMLGVTTIPLAQNSFARWRENGVDSVGEFEREAHAHASVIMWYADWANVRHPDVGQLRAVADRGSLPEITWEPWNYRRGLRVSQPKYRLRRIIDGRYDALVRRWARGLAAYGGPVRLRFGHEMNGNWYPWCEGSNGNRPGEFVKAWRRVWRIFKQEGATNVEWVWSPVAPGIKEVQYPGDAYVDRLGVSGFIGGVQLRFGRWRSFETAVGPALNKLEKIAPRKPIEISEVGVSERRPGDKAAWIRGMFRTLARRPRVDTVTWFNLDKGSDWRIESSAASVRSFQTGARAGRVGQRVARFSRPSR